MSVHSNWQFSKLAPDTFTSAATSHHVFGLPQKKTYKMEFPGYNSK
ncbi:hypothetical protein UYSO10_2830 [Kosakonia radicincitans]|nr:hypothetical protein UYSO10_2830 [Kosakonia radicincitans]